jgi:hypothetical protein
MEVIANRTGTWYLGVASVTSAADLAAVVDMTNCSLTTSQLGWDFNTTEYVVQTYTSGCYYFDEKMTFWGSTGMTVRYVMGDATSAICFDTAGTAQKLTKVDKLASSTLKEPRIVNLSHVTYSPWPFRLFFKNIILIFTMHAFIG